MISVGYKISVTFGTGSALFRWQDVGQFFENLDSALVPKTAGSAVLARTFQPLIAETGRESNGTGIQIKGYVPYFSSFNPDRKITYLHGGLKLWQNHFMISLSQEVCR